MKITINYNKFYGVDGTVYSQIIKIDKNLMQKYNNRLRYLYKKIEVKKNVTHTFNCDDMCINLYTKPLRKGTNFLKFTGLFEFYKMIQKKGIDTKRLKLDRNTIIEVL